MSRLMSLARNKVPSMDVVLWFGITCSIIIIVFTVVITLFGAKAARPPDWATQKQTMGIAEAERRGLYSTPTIPG